MPCSVTSPLFEPYQGMQIEHYTDQGEDCLLHPFATPTLYMTSAYCLAWETLHDILWVDADGVHIQKKGSDGQAVICEGVLLDPFESYDYEHLLFVGECIRVVEKTEAGYIVHLDHVELKVVPCEAGAVPLSPCHVPNRKDLPLYGLERYVTRQCPCGAKGMLFMDHVDDYVMSCPRCHFYTEAYVYLMDAIAAWNRGEPLSKIDEWCDSAETIDLF